MIARVLHYPNQTLAGSPRPKGAWNSDRLLDMPVVVEFDALLITFRCRFTQVIGFIPEE